MTIFDQIIQAHSVGRRATIKKIIKESPMYDATALRIDGRKVQFDNHWVIDFASCNYLGYDLNQTIIDSIEPALNMWGIHPSWCRLVASPNLYSQSEELLASLLGVEATLILPTVTLIHIGVIPALLGQEGVIFLDKSAHMTLYEGAKMARDNGSLLFNFDHKDYNTLEDGLRKYQNNPQKLILVDGVYSMTGNYANIPVLAELAQKYNAILYVDDAHGFGVIGEKPNKLMPYGFKGNGIVRHFQNNYDNILYVSGFSKAYSSLAAGISCSHRMKNFLKAYATPYDLSGPCPTASLQSLISGLSINEKQGDQIRTTLYQLTLKTINGLRAQGFYIDNDTYFPIISVWIGNTDYIKQAAQILWQNGILVTLAPYPIVKQGHESLRITITAANTILEVNKLLKAFEKVKAYLNSENHSLVPNL